jgi:nucleoside-diphosphate-sugar epimerase
LQEKGKMAATVLITGTSGMVGKAVLIECLESQSISKVIMINRSSIDLKHEKLKEIVAPNFELLANFKDEIGTVDACFHCMGVSVVGLTEEQYSKITVGYTKILTDLIYDLNSKAVFTYVSGAGTDSTENGSTMWARVKGKAENYILNKGFKDAYVFRPGAIIPEKGVKSKTKLYNFFYVISKPFYPLLKKMDSITTSSSLGLAMINCLYFPQENKHLENPDISKLAKAHL